jgi:hypothetical protein
MRQFHPAWAEHQRRYWMRPDAERYVRPDAHRFMPPGTPQRLGADAVRYFWPEHKTQPARTRHDEPGHARDDEFLRELAARRADLLRLRRELAAINAELKFRRFLRGLKAGFNPNQPRVPRGSPGGGQWTGDGGTGSGDGSGRNDPRILSDATPDNDWQPGAQYAQAKPPDSPNKLPSKVPSQRPSAVQERHQIARQVAKHGRGRIGALLRVAEWLTEFGPSIRSYWDQPKTFDELQQAVTGRSEPGYEDHHIVGRAARKESDDERTFPEEWINLPENIVRIPKFKHWDINRWYETKNFDEKFKGLSPREYLRGKDWSERYNLGLEILIEHKILKP